MTPGPRGPASRRCAAAATLVAALALATATTATAAAGIGLTPGTVDATNPLTRSYFIHSVNPGESWSSFVVVTNTGDVAVPVYAYPTDGVTSTNSGAVYTNRGEGLTRSGAWIATPQSVLTLAPHVATNVHFTVSVPTGASPGDHLAGIAIEPQTRTQGAGQLQVTTITRSVMAVLIQVPPAGLFHLTITRASILPTVTTGTASVVLRLGNDGIKLGKPKISITLTGPAGYNRTIPSSPCDTGREFCGNLDTILPGDAIDFPFPWPDTLVDGDYTIRVSGSWEVATNPGVDAGKVTYLTTFHLATTLKATVGEAPFVAPPPAVPSSLPGLIIAVLSTLAGVLVVGLVAYFAVIRRRRHQPSMDGEAPQRP